MRHIISGLDISYRVIGEGKPLLILHGWGSKSDNWLKVGELLAKKGLKVIIPDLPGFGRSEEPRGAGNLDDYSDFVEEFVSQLGLNRFYLLGHSFGGSLAVKFSLQHPEKVAKLILVAPACIRKKGLKNKLFKFISKFFKIKTPFLRKLFYRKSDYLSVQGVMKEIYLKIIKEDLTNILSQIKIPTIIIWGAKDKITPIKQAKLINSKIRNSKLEILSGANHDLNSKVPEKLAEIIIKYL